jgi:hypothetical protein
MGSLETLSLWKNASAKRFNLYKSKDDTQPIELGVGDTIIWNGRLEYAKITDVLGIDTEVGPRGFIYLPYRREGRWASRAFSLRGDPRFIICYPAGTPHYGLHIPLHTILKDEAPLLTTQKTIHSILFHGALVELRHLIYKTCLDADIQYRQNESTYDCSKEETTFILQIYKIMDGYHLEFTHVTGNHVIFGKCKESFDALHR